jgi:RimJ/RimL family protein N-acetyltransferase
MIEIRLFKPTEFDDFYAIRREALVAAPEAFLIKVEDFDSQPVDEERYRFTYNASNSHRMIAGAWVDGRIRGMIGLFRQKVRGFENRAMAWGVFSSPNARGLGLGQQMMRLLTEKAAQIEGVDRIVLSVLSANSQAILFYEKIGMERFAPAENDPLLGHSQAGEDVFMVYHLDSKL